MNPKPFAAYDFGLTPEQETRAARLHADSIVVDMLFQGPCGYRSFTPDVIAMIRTVPETASPTEKYFAAQFAPIRAALAGKCSDFRDCWDQSGITAGNRQVGFGTPAYAIAQAQFDAFPWLAKALKAHDIRTAKAAGSHAGFISTQDADGLQDRRLDHLQVAFDLGLRMMGLSYNVQNAVAGGLADRFDGGITAFGVEVIRRMDELGIIVDLSHSSRQATLDACEMSRNPVVISHASAAKLIDITRAKSDEELQAIAHSGGVIGVAAAPGLITTPERLTIDVMLDHIDYIARLVGWRHVGIGTDWPLQADSETMERVFVAMKHEYAPRNMTGSSRALDSFESCASLEGFGDYRDFPNLTRGLVSRGYADEQVRGILGGNFLRVFEAVCG